MSKRELAEASGAPAAERPRVEEDKHAQDKDTMHDEGMGEFEDPFEDEIESDEGEVVDAADEEGMEIDGVPVSGKIQEIGDEDEEVPAPAEAYIPGVNKVPEGQALVPDQSAYDMLHRMDVNWPCLSFDFLRDHLGSQRQTMPHTAYLVAGTQADTAKNNEILVTKASAMHRTSRDDGTYVRARRQRCLEAFGCMSSGSMPKTNSLPFLTLLSQASS